MRSLFLVSLALFLALSPSFAQEAAPQKIRVVTRDIEPFSFEKDGKRVGYAMELWDRVSRETGLQYEVNVVKSAQEMVDALAKKEADAGVGALSVTATREAIIDFTQPFYESGLRVLVKKGNSSFGDALYSLVSGFLNLKVIGMFALLIFAMLVISHLVWMFEHKTNADMWPEKYVHGLWESFWWTISTLLVGGADNKGPVGVGGRIIAIIWMLLSIVLVSLLTASFTTTLTVNQLSGGIQGPGDLPNKTVATVGGSTSEAFLQKIKAVVLPFATVDECVAALADGKAEAVVFDAPMLQYAVKKSGNEDLDFAGDIFGNQNYAIGLQQDSPLRETINRALLNLHEQGVGTELKEQWFGPAE